MEDLFQLASPRNGANMAKKDKIMTYTKSAVNTIFNDSDHYYLRTNSQQNKKIRFAQRNKKFCPRFNEGGKNNE